MTLGSVSRAAFRSLLYGLYLLAFGEAFLWGASLLSKDARLILSNRFGKEPLMNDDVLGLRPNPEYGDHDRWGFRNVAGPSRTDIVALGDSQTYGVCASREHAWPQQLSVLTGRSVYNMACGGWAPPHYLRLLPKALELKPSVVLTAVYSGNDLWDSVYVVYALNSIAEFSDDVARKQEMVRVVRQTLPIVEDASRREASLMKPGFHRGSAAEGSTMTSHSAALRTLVREHSKLWGLWRALRRIGQGRDVAKDDTGRVDESHWQELAELAKSDPGLILYQRGGVRTVLNVGYRSFAFDDRFGAEGLSIVLRSLQLIDDQLRSKGVKHVVVLIPTKEYVYSRFCLAEARDRKAYLELVEREERTWAETKRFLENGGIAFLDVAPALVAAIDQGLQIYPYSSQSHPSAVGYGCIARAIAERLGELGAIPDPQPPRVAQ